MLCVVTCFSVAADVGSLHVNLAYLLFSWQYNKNARKVAVRDFVLPLKVGNDDESSSAGNEDTLIKSEKPIQGT